LVLLAAVLALAGVAGSAQSSALAQDVAPIAPAVAIGHVEARSFWSASLERTMPYRAHLDDHLRFYNASLKRRAARSTIS